MKLRKIVALLIALVVCSLIVSSSLALSSAVESLLTPDIFMNRFNEYAQSIVEMVGENEGSAAKEIAGNYLTITDMQSDPKGRQEYTNKDKSIRIIFDVEDINDGSKPGTRVVFSASGLSDHAEYEVYAKMVFTLIITDLNSSIDMETMVGLLDRTDPAYIEIDDGYRIVTMGAGDPRVWFISLPLTN